MAVTNATAIKVCLECNTEFVGHGNSKRCSPRCVNKARENRRAVACTRCGRRMWHSRSRAEFPACQPCRSDPTLGTHGDAGYRRGCRCDECKAGAAARNRDYSRRFRDRTGTSLRAQYPDGSERHWISTSRRLEIYVRDEWSCWLCGELTDREADVNSDYAPSLDHVAPRSQGGSHASENLRCAHRICNARRGAREVPHVSN